jgi:hypothetical protein
MLACLKWNLPPSHLSQSPPITVSLSEGTVDSNLVGTKVTRSGAGLTPERWRRARSSFFGFGRAFAHCCTGSTGSFRQMERSPGPKPEPLDSDFVRQLKAKMAAEGWNQTELAAHAATTVPAQPQCVETQVPGSESTASVNESACYV